MPKISDLNISLFSDISNEDSLLFVDSETSSTKQIKLKDLIKVIADSLDLKLKKDIGADLPKPIYGASQKTCGVPVSVSAMASDVAVDNFSVSPSEILLNFQYNTYNLPNRFVVVAEKESFYSGSKEETRELLYDTRDEVSGSATISLCKPAGFTSVKVYIMSSAKSSYTYTLSCTTNSCLFQTSKQFNVTPTPSSTPIASPTPTPSSRNAGYVAVSLTPSVTATQTATPSVTPSISPTITPSNSVGATSTPTPTASPAVTSTPTPTTSSLVTASPTPTPTESTAAP